jgi:hypothetical protein
MPERVAVGDVIYPSYDAGASGLTVGLQITNKATGASLLARTTAGIAEVPASGGSYDYQTGYTVPASVPAFKVSWNNSAGAIVATEDYIVGETSDTLATQLSGTVTITAPVASDGDVTLTRGDDYYDADDRALEWTTSDSATWPVLTSATITFAARIGGQTLTKAGSVVQATGANKSVRVELASADTASLKPGHWTYDVQAVLSNGHSVTLQAGALNLRDAVAA